MKKRKKAPLAIWAAFMAVCIEAAASWYMLRNTGRLAELCRYLFVPQAMLVDFAGAKAIVLAYVGAFVELFTVLWLVFTLARYVRDKLVSRRGRTLE